MSTKQHSLAASLIVTMLISILPTPAWGSEAEAEVRSTIQAFYNAFNNGFTQPAAYAAEDWNHVNPFGGRTRSRLRIF